MSHEEIDARLLRYLEGLDEPRRVGVPGPAQSERMLRPMLVALGVLTNTESRMSKTETRAYDLHGQRLQALKRRGLVRQESRRYWFRTERTL